MEREEALSLISTMVKSQNLVKHMLAAEAIMTALARRLGQNEDEWALAGLLHDLDYDFTEKDPASHGLVSVALLADRGLSEGVLQAIRSHNEKNGSQRTSLMDKALWAVDPLTGLIVASALIHPDKKLSSIDVRFVLNRFKEKLFAKGANREQIKSCSEIGLELEEFVKIGLEAMQRISSELGL